MRHGLPVMRPRTDARIASGTPCYPESRNFQLPAVPHSKLRAMRRLIIATLVVGALAACAFSSERQPVRGRWDFNLTQDGTNRAAWLGITDKAGALDVWYQPTGGNVFELKDVKVESSKLVLAISAANRPATARRHLGTPGLRQSVARHRDRRRPFHRSWRPRPELKRAAPRVGPLPSPVQRQEPGWMGAIGSAASHWTVQDGLLVNQEHGANSKPAAGSKTSGPF